MGLYETLNKDYITARKSQDKYATGILSMVISDLKYEKINKQKELEESDVLAYMQKNIKQKNDVIVEYKNAGRQDLVDKETGERDFLQKYMPEALSEDELKAIIKKAISEVNASGPSDMGKVMGVVMPQTKGRADGGVIRTLVQEALQ